MATSLTQLFEKYLLTRYPSQSRHREGVRDSMTLYIKHLEEKYPGYYSTLSDGDIGTDPIYQDTCEFLIALPSSNRKAVMHKLICEFWTFFYESGEIRNNPVQEIAAIKIPMTKLERQIELLKFLSGKEKSIQEIQRQLLYSERTIRDDIRDLREGRTFSNYIAIEEFGTEDNHIKFGSSVHPIILALNMTSLVELMVALEDLSQSQYIHHHALELVRSQIMPQLTDYAKEKLNHAGITLDGEREKTSFVSEGRYLQGNVNSQLLYGLKSGEPIKIEVNHKGVTFEQTVYVVRIIGSGNESKYVFKAHKQGDEFILPLQAIIKVSTERDG